MNGPYCRGSFSSASYSYSNVGEKIPPAKRKAVGTDNWPYSIIAPCDDVLLFYVGVVYEHGMDKLIADLNRARISTGIVEVTAYTSRTSNYSFLGWENWDQQQSMTKIFAAPKTNDWKFKENQRAEEILNYERAHPLICTFIEGWLASKKR